MSAHQFTHSYEAMVHLSYSCQQLKCDMVVVLPTAAGRRSSF